VAFAFRYGFWRPLLVVLGVGPTFSRVEVTDDALRIRMGWAFRALVPRASIVAARRAEGRFWSIGVHGWRGRWLVNGSRSGIVSVDISPAARARVIGFPVRLRTVHLGLEDPDGFLRVVS
jgi:hypothetical protein